MAQHGLAESRRWTRPQDYVEAMARKRTARRASQSRQRSEPEAPRLLLSTAPFLLLMGLLAVMTAAIAIIAYPGAQPQPRESQTAAREQGVAAPGWFQEAQKEFHR